MPITFVAAAKTPTSFPGSNNTSTCNIAKPTGTLDGHLMIAIIQSGGGITISAPGGWTEADTYVHAGGANLTNGLYWKIASSEGSSYTFTDDSGSATPLCGAILTFSGTHTTAPINVVSDAESAGTDTKSTPSATTTERCLMLHVRVGKTTTVASQGTFAAVTNYTDRVAFANRGDGTQYFVEALSLTAATIVNAGSQAGISFNADHTLTGSIERQIGIREDTPTTNAPATVASATATAYNVSSLTSSSTAAFAAATATAYDITSQTGVAAEATTHAAATATAYDAMGWVIHPVDIGAIAFDATVQVTTNAEYASATASTANQVGYFGAPARRTYIIPAEPRTLDVPYEDRTHGVT